MATAPKSEILYIAELVSYQDGSVVSRQITKVDAGNVTLFAFDKDQELSEHNEPHAVKALTRFKMLLTMIRN